jgi:septum site-determining protein MinC
MSTSKTTVSIKGTKSGLQIVLDDGLPFDEALEQLAARLEATDAFFQGSRVALDIGERIVSREEWSRLEENLRRKNLILTAVLAAREESRRAARSLGIPLVTESRHETYGADRRRSRPEGDGASEGLFIRQTLRSGQIVRYPGSVTIIGDVNAGAEVIAEGDVIVWGSLRGVVHAGASGDEKAIVGALHLAPTQLRLAGHVARSPGNRPRWRAGPEVALLRDGHIVVEEWSGAQHSLEVSSATLLFLALVYTIEAIVLAVAIRLLPASWSPFYLVAIVITVIVLGWLVALFAVNRHEKV